MHNYQIVLFDFDGTLADTANGVFSSACYAMNTMYGSDLKNEDVKHFMGPPLLESFLKEGHPEKDFPQFIKLYGYYYDNFSLEETEFYPNALECLKSLYEMDVKVGIASTKTKKAIRDILMLRGMDKYVQAVCATDRLGEVVTKSSMIKNALIELNAQGDESILMVGDRYLDAKGAEECGLDFVAVTCSGLTDIKEFQEYKVIKYINDLKEIVEIVK